MTSSALVAQELLKKGKVEDAGDNNFIYLFSSLIIIGYLHI
jgi:hypothetical protein